MMGPISDPSPATAEPAAGRRPRRAYAQLRRRDAIRLPAHHGGHPGIVLVPGQGRGARGRAPGSGCGTRHGCAACRGPGSSRGLCPAGWPGLPTGPGRECHREHRIDGIDHRHRLCSQLRARPDRARHRDGGGTGREVPGMIARASRRRPGEDGSAALELVMLAPVLLALLCLVIAAGRTSIAQGSVDAAARDAARQASIALTPAAARLSGQLSAEAALRSDGLDCDPVVAVDTSQFAIPPGEPAFVTAIVSCTVSLANLALPGLPGTARLQATFTSPLDIYRSR